MTPREQAMRRQAEARAKMARERLSQGESTEVLRKRLHIRQIQARARRERERQQAQAEPGQMTPEQEAAILRARQRMAIQSARERLSQPEPGQMQGPFPAGSLGAREAAGEGVMPFAPGQEGPQLPPEAQQWADQTGDTLRRNVMGGSEPGQETFGENLGTALNMAGESLTFGLVGDEAAAGADALIGRGDYGDRLEHYRGEERRMESEHPVASMGARLAPLAIPGKAGADFVMRGGSLGARALRSGALGGAAGGVYGFMEGEGGLENRLDSAQSGAALGGAVGVATPAVGEIARRLTGRGPRAQAKRAARDVESVDDLRAAASQRYDDAARMGVTAQQPQTAQLARSIRDTATNEGLITPSGRIAESYPRIRDAINMADDFAQGGMDPRQMQAFRRTLQGAASSTDKAERRVGTMMLRQFDDFVEPLAPQFREANQLYARAARGNTIDEAVELAGIRAGQFSGSGFENALRTEFRRLSRDIARGKMRGLTPEQIEAIRRVADGGPVENILRGIGKAAPTGVVSAAGGGGMGYLIGNTLGGPGVGAAVGAGTMAAGALGRRAATTMQRTNADIVNALMRSPTGSLPQASPGRVPEIVQRLLMFSGSVPAEASTGPLSR